MSNYEFYSEGFSSVEARDELYFKIVLKQKIQSLESQIRNAETYIKTEKDNDITGLRIYDIQDLYSRLDKAKALLIKFEENLNKYEYGDDKIPLKDFLWEYNDGKFRTEKELKYNDKNYIKEVERINSKSMWLYFIIILGFPALAFFPSIFHNFSILGYLAVTMICLPLTAILACIAKFGYELFMKHLLKNEITEEEKVVI